MYPLTRIGFRLFLDNRHTSNIKAPRVLRGACWQLTADREQCTAKAEKFSSHYLVDLTYRRKAEMCFPAQKFSAPIRTPPLGRRRAACAAYSLRVSEAHASARNFASLRSAKLRRLTMLSFSDKLVLAHRRAPKCPLPAAMKSKIHQKTFRKKTRSVEKPRQLLFKVAIFFNNFNDFLVILHKRKFCV